MKKSKIYLSILAIFAVIVAIQACTKSMDDEIRYERILQLDTSIDYNNTDYPQHMQGSLNTNVSNAKAALGRVLFYDEILSRNSRVSCASCHLQQHAFSDVKAASSGFAMGQTPRNSMAISNLVMNEWVLFWDLRASNLQEQVTMPLVNHLEMGNSSLEEVIERINSLDYYPALFESAYGTSEANETTVADALRDFIRALRSYESDFDNANPEIGNGWGSENVPDLEDPAQRAGFELFGDLGCASCHSGNNIGGHSSANIGLDEVYADSGMNSWTNDPEDVGVFKVPSLRNVALTAPYMHDGRFKNLDEVLSHYSNGIKSHPNLDWRLVDLSGFDFELSDLLLAGMDPISYFEENEENDPVIEALLASERIPVRMNLSEQDKSNLIAFLESLTDKEYISDPRYSDPFVSVEIK
ncbi:MAG: cytochrome-c peroxidase [Flavobacteriales bacterium]